MIVDFSNVTNMDYSAAEAFYHGAEALKKSEISLKLAGLRVSYSSVFDKKIFCMARQRHLNLNNCNTFAPNIK